MKRIVIDMVIGLVIAVIILLFYVRNTQLKYMLNYCTFTLEQLKSDSQNYTAFVNNVNDETKNEFENVQKTIDETSSIIVSADCDKAIQWGIDQSRDY